MHKKAKEILKDLRILVVEDEQDLREILVESIKEYSQTVLAAPNGMEGLELYHSHDIDLIISDIHMAKMNGLRMSHEIRKIDPFVPIIFLTAYDTDENMMEAIKIKSRSVLKKPFDKRQLILTMVLAISSFREEFTWLDLSHGFTFNIDTKELFFQDTLIALTKKESLLLELLLKHKNYIVSFTMIESYVWSDSSATLDAIRMFVNKLRKKIYPELIENLQGVGYKLCIK